MEETEEMCFEISEPPKLKRNRNDDVVMDEEDSTNAAIKRLQQYARKICKHCKKTFEPSNIFPSVLCCNCSQLYYLVYGKRA